MVFTPITRRNLDVLEAFYDSLLDGRANFRYFEKRPFSITSYHVLTLIGWVSGHAVVYGHLDKEEDRVWLGIAVSDKYVGNGYGKEMMSELTRQAGERGIEEIWLSVDKTNVKAEHLYRKFGFSLAEERDNFKLMTLKID